MEWLKLDGYGIYVWPSYALTFGLLGWHAVRSYLQFRKTLNEVNQYDVSKA